LISSRHPADRRVEGADSASIAGSTLTVNVPIKPKGYVYHVVTSKNSSRQVAANLTR
jgi:hypothetical protein